MVRLRPRSYLKSTTRVTGPPCPHLYPGAPPPWSPLRFFSGSCMTAWIPDRNMQCLHRYPVSFLKDPKTPPLLLISIITVLLQYTKHNHICIYMTITAAPIIMIAPYKHKPSAKYRTRTKRNYRTVTRHSLTFSRHDESPIAYDDPHCSYAETSSSYVPTRIDRRVVCELSNWLLNA